MRLYGKNGVAHLMAGVAAGAIVMGASAAWAQSKPITVEPQPLMSALHDFGNQTGAQILYAPEILNAKVSSGVTGAENEQTALSTILAGTGLTFRREANAYVIVRQGEGGSGPQGESAAAGGADPYAVEALIVTAQKKDEDIQDVPIAISAFTQKSLDAQKIEGGFDLLKAIPNVTFSKTNFSGYNFSIRGIGTQAISATTDPAVAVSFNNTTLIVNRLFEQEYVDVERVEVLRGPQGTLYGRNATSGVINVISAKPVMGDFFGEVKLEGGNFNAQRVRGHLNVPIGETFAVRGAFAATKRDGYGYNEFDGSDVDNRDLWTGRLTAMWEPSERFRTYLMWERFEEDDQRVRTSKQLCHRDPNPTEIGGISTARLSGTNMLSQGCKAGSLYDDGAFGTVNGASLPYTIGMEQAVGLGGFLQPRTLGGGANPYDFFTGPCLALQGPAQYLHDVCNPDVYRGRTQSRDLRSIYSEIQPEYRASSDVYELAVDFEVTDSLTFSSQTVYAKDTVWATQDYNRFAGEPFFTDLRNDACGPLGFGVKDCSDDPDTGRGTYLPLQDLDGDGIIDHANHPLKPREFVDEDGWVRDETGRRVGWYAHFFGPEGFCDPQLGCSSNLIVQDLSRAESEQFNQEFRLVSNFDGPVNFSAGANFTKFETLNDYFVFSNAFTALIHTNAFNSPATAELFGNLLDPDTLPVFSIKPRCLPYEVDTDDVVCRYIDPNPLHSLDGDGHNYFRSANPYELTSTAVFGELYWNLTETLKLTLGGRMTWDQKVFTPIPSQLLLADYRDLTFLGEGDQPVSGEQCIQEAQAGCPLTGNAPNGRGYVANPDIVQNWREPTGRLVVDWKPDLGLSWLDSTMLYASVAHGYKGGGANPPTVAPPAGNVLAYASGQAAPLTFEPEFVNAFEVGSKNTLLGGALTLNAGAFYYDYKDYQVSKIVDRSAANENFDAEIWGVELEGMFAPTRNLRFTYAFGYLDTKVGEGESSIDLMDRGFGGDTPFTTPDGVTWNGYSVVKPWIVSASNCIVPTQILMAMAHSWSIGQNFADTTSICPAGGIQGGSYLFDAIVPYFDDNGVYVPQSESTRRYRSLTDAPNGSAGFAKPLGGNELPNAPHWTASVGAQYTMELAGGWDATLRGDFYWQSQSYARIYNTQYDKLRAWTNTNVSLWFENRDWDVKAEVYVKNVFDETPITGAFLNSDDSGLTTNVFTLDPRLVGVAVTKSF